MAIAPVVLGLTVAVMLAGAAAGRHPMWPLADVNLSEAAASRDAATVAWLIEQGEDPDRPRRVRSGFLDTREYASMTPTDAAVRARRLEIVHLLLRNGASLAEADRVAYACRARAAGDEELAGYFEARGGAVACSR